MSKLLSIKVLIPVLVLGLLATYLLTSGGPEPKTVTAHFPRAVSVYKGTDVRILGVNVGRVTKVTPDGDSVRVEMEYDAKYQVPANASAVVVTPTLVSDRFIQLTPAYTKGVKEMASGADIPLPQTGVPVELDRIYKTLRDLTATLGPNGLNKDGTLNHTLTAAAKALNGQGARANQMIQDLSAAAVTFGEGSGDLFTTITQLASFTGTLADNDQIVRGFLQDLTGVSADLADERVELAQALKAVSSAVGTVEGFVKTNRKALVTDVEKLTRVLGTINSEKKSLDTALAVAPVAIGNLSLAFNQRTRSVGSRINIAGNVGDADGFLCAVVQQSAMPVVSKKLACQIFEKLLEPLANAGPATLPPGAGRTSLGGNNRPQPRYVVDASPSLESMLSGGVQ